MNYDDTLTDRNPAHPDNHPQSEPELTLEEKFSEIISEMPESEEKSVILAYVEYLEQKIKTLKNHSTFTTLERKAYHCH